MENHYFLTAACWCTGEELGRMPAVDLLMLLVSVHAPQVVDTHQSPKLDLRI